MSGSFYSNAHSGSFATDSIESITYSAGDVGSSGILITL